MIAYKKLKSMLEAFEKLTTEHEGNVISLAGDYAFDGKDVKNQLIDEFEILEKIQVNEATLYREDVNYD